MTNAAINVKVRSLVLLIVSQISAMSLWFVSSAILPDMAREFAISETRQAALASAVPVGFVIGALFSAVMGLSDRFDPRRVFAICALLAAASGACLLVVYPGGGASIFLRGFTGAMLAGVYPVGMKIAVGWGEKDRGLLVGLLVGALTIGSASPHLVAFLGGADWRLTILIVSGLTVISALLILLAGLGPYHRKAPKFDASVIAIAWTNKRVRYAYLGYFGHMWELYAMWAWIGVASLASYQYTMSQQAAVDLSKLTAFLAIGVGGIACVLGGYVADRIGKIQITILAMAVSGLAAVATALSFGGPVWITFVLILIWGVAIIPDSPQFSALVADASPPENAGSLMTFQTALGFTLTVFTVQLTPWLVSLLGWPIVLAAMGLGPAFGIYFMLKLRNLAKSA